MSATSFSWTNWLMNLWDAFIEYHFGCVPYNNLKDLEKLNEDERKK